MKFFQSPTYLGFCRSVKLSPHRSGMAQADAERLARVNNRGAKEGRGLHRAFFGAI